MSNLLLRSDLKLAMRYSEDNPTRRPYLAGMFALLFAVSACSSPDPVSTDGGSTDSGDAAETDSGNADGGSTIPTCIVGVEGSILADCIEAHRTCEVGPPAVCGDCLLGYLAEGGLCVQDCGAVEFVFGDATTTCDTPLPVPSQYACFVGGSTGRCESVFE